MVHFYSYAFRHIFFMQYIWKKAHNDVIQAKLLQILPAMAIARFY